MLQSSHTQADEAPRVAPGTQLGNFDRALYKSRQYVAKAGDISPELATEMLERGGDIHDDSTARPKLYAAAMAGGDWLELIPDQVAFNWDGKLINGRKRLQAIVMSGVTAHNMTIAFGFDPAVYPAIDSLPGRQAKHLMRLAGVPKSMAAPLTQGVKLFQRYTTAVQEGKIPRSTRFTPKNLHDFHIQHQEFLGLVEDVMILKQKWREVMPPAVAFTLAYMALKKNHPRDVVLGFIKLLGNFAGQDDRHPALVLWNSLSDDMKDTKNKKGVPKLEQALVKSIRAFNKWVRKGKMSVVYGIGIPEKEFDGEETADDRLKFPVVIGYHKPTHRNVNQID